MRSLSYLLLLWASSICAAPFIYHSGSDLQKTINDAQAFSTIVCERNERITVSNTFVINKPLTLSGLNAQLVKGLGKTSILRVECDHVSITDFELHGNADSVDQSERAPLLLIEASDFRVERGRFFNSSKDGIEVNTKRGGGDTVGGVIRDIVSDGVVRDTVSISGSFYPDGLKVRNVLVENIRAHNSARRGAVEVSDGVENITVRTVFAENCRYAVDIQDHGHKTQINKNIVVDDVYAVDCRHAIRTENNAFGHENLTIQNVVAKRCERPVEIFNTDRVHLSNIRVLEHSGEHPATHIKNCSGISILNVDVNGESLKSAVLIQSSNRLRLNGLNVDESANFSSGVTYQITRNHAYSNLTIQNVSVPAHFKTGILLENTSQSGTLENYIVSMNMASVNDQIKGKGALVAGNVQSE